MAVRTMMDDTLEQAVTTGKVAGIVAAAADRSGVIYQGAFGSREAGADMPMTLDTVFKIASMTKAVTSVAAMQLVERGELTLDEPLGGRFPELDNLQVLEGFDASDQPNLRPARGPVTMRQLLTHTAGFSGAIWNAQMARYMEQTAAARTAQYGERANLFLPLVFDPGTRWEYGISTDWVGQVVEMISGQRLDHYIREHISGPLGMADTDFLYAPDREARLATMHQRQPDGSVQAIEHAFAQTGGFIRGAGGLHSTATDYLRFLRALLQDGALDGARILKPETVAEMNVNQMGDINVEVMRTVSPLQSNDAELFPGTVQKWGLGYLINTEPGPAGRSAGSLAWAGLFNTYYWLDPAQGVTGLIMTQTLPFADPDVLATLSAFERAVYDTIGA